MNATLRLFDGYDHTSPHLEPVVRYLQQKLTDAGCWTEVDGMFGHGTDDAVRSFQRRHGLTDDGIVGPRTWSALEGKPAPSVTMYESTYAFHDVELLQQSAQAQAYADYIRWSGQEAGVHQSIICGIGSRESRWGRALRPPTPDGTGDFARRGRTNEFRHDGLPPDGKGFGRGLMQIDYDAHEFARGNLWKEPARNIAYAGGVLRDNIKYLKQRMPNLTGEALLRAALAAYNCGPGNVVRALENKRSPDYYTTGRDYSRDVLSRAGWFQMHGW